MKNTKTISKKNKNGNTKETLTTNSYIDALLIAREVDDKKTENLIIKMLKMQGTPIDWAGRQYA